VSGGREPPAGGRGRRRGSPSGSGRRREPTAVGDALASYLEQSGLAARVEQAGIVPEWAALVGPEIARVTEPISISRDGTLFVAVRTNAWMAELSLLEPQLLAELNRKSGRPPVSRIHWRLMAAERGRMEPGGEG
jgi:predicted nucleic acid-binding Zn ribbon protein